MGDNSEGATWVTYLLLFGLWTMAPQPIVRPAAVLYSPSLNLSRRDIFSRHRLTEWNSLNFCWTKCCRPHHIRPHKWFLVLHDIITPPTAPPEIMPPIQRQYHAAHRTGFPYATPSSAQGRTTNGGNSRRCEVIRARRARISGVRPPGFLFIYTFGARRAVGGVHMRHIPVS